MALSRIKSRRQLKAVKKFTDREAPREVFTKHVLNLTREQNYFRVLSYYGVGGIGKTSLLKNLRETLEASHNLCAAHIDCEAQGYSSFCDILLDLYKQCPVTSYVFEYAVASYYGKQGLSVQDISKSLISDESLLFDLQEVAADLAETVAPARLLKRLAEKSYERVLRMRREVNDEIQAIDNMDARDLEEHLPFYLGDALGRWQSRVSENRAVIFVDTHEACLHRDIFSSTKEKGDGWLEELIGSAEFGLFVIAGRESLKWENPEWKAVIDSHMLGSLDKADADDFLKHVPIEEESVRKTIVETAKGVPVYLDLCADTYCVKKANSQVVTAEDFALDEAKVIDRFLAHLDTQHAEAIKAMSLCLSFDEKIFDSVLKALNIHFPSSQFSEFCEGSYAVQVAPSDGMYKIHRIIRDHLFDEADVSTAKRVFEAIIGSAHETVDQNLKRAVWMLSEAVSLMKVYDAEPSEKYYIQITRTVLTLIDHGLWDSAFSSVSVLNESFFKSSKGAPFIDFMMGLCERKRGNLKDAIFYYDRAERKKNALGPFRALLDYHSAHCAHLLGDFPTARATYVDLSALEPKCAAEKDAQLLATRQLADVQMIEGRFVTALKTFNRLIDISSAALWRAEVQRFRGHTFRFNCNFRRAEEVYRNAYDIAVTERADAMRGKALTNLAETSCWTSPETSIDYAKRSVELNREVNAPIEVGKALAAKSIAYSMAGNFDSATSFAGQAAAEQNKTGYKNGVLYALQAEGLALYFMGDIAGAERVVTKMKELSSEVTVYGFLSLILEKALKAPDVESRYDNYEWIDKAATIKTHGFILSCR